MARKGNDRRELFKKLKKGDVAPIYYLHGPDALMLETAVGAVVDAALPNGPNDFNFQKFGGNDASAEAVRNAAETLPFMTERRVVVLQDVPQMPSQEFEALTEYFADPAPTTVLIVVAMTASKKLDGRTAPVKALRKAAQEYEFKELREWEVSEVVERNARSLGISLDRDAIAYLVEAVGTDLSTLVGALEKIDLYIGTEQKKARVEDVQAIVTDTRVKSIFDLTDAVGARNFGAALKILDRMLVAGESAIGITAMFARHFRIVGRLQDPKIAGMRKNDAAKAIRVSPYFVKDYLADAGRFARTEIERIRRRLVETDLALKSSRLTDRVIMEALLFDICNRATETGQRSA